MTSTGFNLIALNAPILGISPRSHSGRTRALRQRPTGLRRIGDGLVVLARPTDRLMDRNDAEYRYTTKLVRDERDRFAALELHRTLGRDPAGIAKRVPRVVFWDAEGQLSIETFGTDISVDVAEISSRRQSA
jgi:hypothetical protein